MKKSILAAFAVPAMVAGLALPAFAETVDFTTTGSFSCASLVADNAGETCATSGGGSMMTVTKGTTVVTVVAATGDSYVGLVPGPTPSSDVDVMTIDDMYKLAKNAPNAPTVGLTGSTFTFTVDQTACMTCGTGTASLTGNITGTINSVNSSAAITYPYGQVGIGGIQYILDNQTWVLAEPGKTTPSNPYGQAIYTAQVLPEPTFLLLSGLGFGVVAFVAYRRRRTA